MEGRVETPETPQAPNNYVVRALDGCDTVEKCRALLKHAAQHGYAEEGQTMTLIKRKIADLGDNT